MRNAIGLRPLTTADLLAMRGILPAYHQGETNRCPGCGRSNWIMGRTGAECAFDGTFLPFAIAGVRPVDLDLAA